MIEKQWFPRPKVPREFSFVPTKQVQCSHIMRFTVRHNRHHRVSQSVPLFMHCKTVAILLRIWVRGHFVMSNTSYHESHYVTVLDNPPSSNPFLTGSFNLSHFALAIENSIFLLCHSIGQQSVKQLISTRVNPVQGKTQNEMPHLTYHF